MKRSDFINIIFCKVSEHSEYDGTSAALIKFIVIEAEKCGMIPPVHPEWYGDRQLNMWEKEE